MVFSTTVEHHHHGPFAGVPATDSVFFGVPAPPDRLVGRSDVLAEIGRRLEDDSQATTAPIVTLAGMGGIGKSSLAAAYCYESRRSYSLIWWIVAESEEQLAQEYLRFARWLGFDESDAGSAAGRVQSHLDQRESWLVVFDSAPDRQTIHPWIPRPGSRGSVLITSRDPVGWLQPVNVGVITSDDAAEWLLVCSGDRDAESDAAVALAVELGGLPLAIAQALAFVEEVECGIEGYLTRFRSRRASILHEGAPVDYGQTVATTVGIAFDHLASVQPGAASLLAVCALCAPDRIPRAVVAHPDVLGVSTADGCDRAVAAARRSGLLTVEGEQFSIHRLTQICLRSSELVETRTRALTHRLRVLYPQRPDQPETWAECEVLSPHVLAVLAVDLEEADRDDLHWLCGLVGMYFQNRVGDLAMAERLAARAVSLASAESGELAGVLAWKDNLATIYRAQGRLHEARRLHDELLASRRSVVGSPNDLLVALTNLAVVDQDLGDLPSAIALQSEAYDLGRSAFGIRDRRTLATMSNLGQMLGQVGDFQRSFSLIRTALELRTETLGPEHPDTLYSMQHLAAVLTLSGDAVSALPLFRQVFEVRSERLGSDHLHVFIAATNLAEVLRLTGDKEDAEALIGSSLSSAERVLGPGHGIVSKLHEIADLLGEST